MKPCSLPMRAFQCAALLLLLALPALAQLQSGNLYGTVKDPSGATLPGVPVPLTGTGAPQVQVPDAQGRFRFPGLAPASNYAVKAEIQGFSPLESTGIVINVGRNTDIELQLSAAVEDVINVVAESPMLDTRRISTGTTVSNSDLERIPTARDPWAVLQSTPGVLTDRINVGGTNEWRGSGRYLQASGGMQSNLSFKNSDLGQAGPWNNNNAQTAFKQGDRIDKIQDYGAELGGPIVKDRLWIWGSYAKPKIDLPTHHHFRDQTTLKDRNRKANAQNTPRNPHHRFILERDNV